MIRFLLITFTSLAFLACTRNTLIVQPGAVPLTIRSILPATSTPGAYVAIRGTGFVKAGVYSVSFGGAIAFPGNILDSMLVARVPWDAGTGPVTVYGTNDSAVGPVFTVMPLCGQSLCVQYYSAGTPLTEQASWAIDCQFRYVKWTAQTSGDTTILSQAYCSGDDSYIVTTLQFRGSSFSLAVSGSFTDREITGTTVTPLQGMVFVQTWDRSGIVSGKLSWWLGPADRNWYDVVFWHDFSK